MKIGTKFGFIGPVVSENKIIMLNFMDNDVDNKTTTDKDDRLQSDDNTSQDPLGDQMICFINKISFEDIFFILLVGSLWTKVFNHS